MAYSQQTTSSAVARERKPNFSDLEIKVLLRGVSGHMDVLRQHQNSTAINQLKKEAYKKITDRVNEITRTEYGGSVVRKLKEVKKKWIELKSTALRIHNARLGMNNANQCQQTKNVPKDGPFTQAVLSILSKTGEVELPTTEHVDIELEILGEKHISRHEGQDGAQGDLQNSLMHEHSNFSGGQDSSVCAQMSVKFEPMESSTDLVDGLPSSDRSRTGVATNFTSSASCSYGMPKNSRRDRKQNFTYVETVTLLREVNKHRDILFMTAQNAEMTKEKQMKWLQIVQQCHLTSGMNIRTVSEVRKKWMNLKLAAMKEREAREKVGAKALPPSAATSPFTEHVLAILEGSFDDAAITEVQEVDFEALLSLDESSEANETVSQNLNQDYLKTKLFQKSMVVLERLESDKTNEFSQPAADLTAFLDEGDANDSGDNDRPQPTSQQNDHDHDAGDFPKPKRERDRNFSREEIDIMLDIHEANKGLLNCKKFDTETNTKKLRVWQSMVDEINKMTGGDNTKRTVAQIRKKLKCLKRDAVKCWQRYVGVVVDDKLPWLERSFVERIINIMDCEEMGLDNFEIYQQDLAIDSGTEGKQKESRSCKEMTYSFALKQHLISLVRICVQLKEIGVDVGAVIFEEANMLCCGSDRLKHIAGHPLLPTIFSDYNQTNTNTGQNGQNGFKNWTVNMMNIPNWTATDAQAAPNSEGDSTSDPQKTQTSTTSPVPAASSSSLPSAQTLMRVLATGEGVTVMEVDKDSDSPILPGNESSDKEGAASGQSLTSTVRADDSLPDEADTDNEECETDMELMEPDSLEQAQKSSLNQSLKDLLQKPPLNGNMKGYEGSVEDEKKLEKEKEESLSEGIVKSERPQPLPNTNSTTTTSKSLITCSLCSFSFLNLSSYLLHTHQIPAKTAGKMADVSSNSKKESGATKNSENGNDQRADADKLTVAIDEIKRVDSRSSRKKTTPVISKAKKAPGVGKRRNSSTVGPPKLSSKLEDSVPASQKGQSEKLHTLGVTKTCNSNSGSMQENEEAKQADVQEVKDSRERRFACSFCGKKFYTPSHRRQHVRIHTGEKPFKCEFCGSSFTQSNSLRIHKRKHTGDRPYSCDLCGYNFYCSSDVVAHKKRQHGLMTIKKAQEEDKYRCELCDLVFPDISRLKVHKRMHTGEKPFECDLCQQKFTEKHNLERHRNRHLGIKAYQCDVCGAKFTEKGNLKVHMRYHSGHKPYKCEFCDEAFYVTSTLKIHRRKHTGERPYLCDLCGASFTQGSKLNSHRRKHTGEKPYRCDDCGEMFKEKDQLNIHQRLHTGVQPYTCRICGKPFQKNSHLAVHTRLHTGERPFTCEVCGEKFARSDVLGLHRKKHAAAMTGSHPAQPGGPLSIPNTLHRPPDTDHCVSLGVPVAGQSAENHHLMDLGPPGGQAVGPADSRMYLQDGMEQTPQLIPSATLPSVMTPSLMAPQMPVLLPGFQYM